MGNSYIKIESTKGIKAHVASTMQVDAERIFWNIRFNIPLNPETVNEESMDVTDVSGYILTSNISYNTESNTIIISPREPYKSNATYILNISKSVLSKGNNPLKEEVQIVFQLKGAEISSFKILKGKEKLNIDIKPSKYAPTPAQQKKDKLPVVNLHMNFWVSIGALIIFVTALFVKQPILIIMATLMVIVGISHIIYQFANPKSASVRSYNKGAQCYNNQEYGEAAEYFDLALVKDPGNQLALRGKDRMLGSSAYVKKSKK